MARYFPHRHERGETIQSIARSPKAINGTVTGRVNSRGLGSYEHVESADHCWTTPRDRP